MTMDAPNTPETTIAQLARTRGASAAARLRQALALEAMSDPTWVAMDRRRRQAGIVVAEQRPLVPLALVEHVRQGIRQGEQAGTRRSLTDKPWIRLALHAVAGIAVGILIVKNPLVPGWYRGWADFGPAVGMTGVSFVTLTLSLMYATGTQTLPRTYRNVFDLLFVTYTAVALHPVAAVCVLISGVSFLSRREIVRRHDAKREANRIQQLVDTLLNTPSLEHNGEIRIGWGRFTGTPVQAADILCARSLELDGFDLGTEDPWLIVDRVAVERDEIDTYSCVLAAELWLLACDATEFEQAASIGPAALGAYAAILARAQGEPATGMPPVAGEEAWPSTVFAATAKIAVFKSAVESECGPGSFTEVATRAAADLSWGGGGNDRCSRMARLLARLASHRPS
jgi:hypothetical protein